MVGLTFVALARLLSLRYRAVSAGRVQLRYFAAFEGAEEPLELRVCARHVANLFEMPILFYAITLIAHVTAAVNLVTVILAWAYVALRAVHSYIHLTSNAVFRRFQVFALSGIVLFALWIATIAGILTG